MRILFLNYEFPPLGGGAANATRYLLEAWRDADGLSIDLVCSSPGRASIETVGARVAVHRLDIGKRGSLHYQSQADLLRYAWAAYRYSRRLMRDHRYDGCLAFFGIPCGVVALGLGLPYIVSLRGSDVPFYNPRFQLLDRLVFQRLSRHIWRSAAAVVANSAGLRGLAQKSAPGQPIGVVPNGVDTTRFAPDPARTAGAGLRLLCVSRLIPRKGIDSLLHAMVMLNPGVRLEIIGSGAQEDALKALSSSLGVSSRVTFSGALPHADLPERYRSADLFVLPSHNEGMSNTVLEAMASGLPVLLTDTGGTGELLRPGVNGALIEAGNPAHIAEQIQGYLGQGDRLAREGAAARATAERFSWQATAEAYAALFDQHFGGKPA
ncbi:MAG: glycosyltransferase [Candidatus Hydrogenedens sp.]|nr:glycosyltransferase [Candidatus Hydrogenedens sp.]